MPRRAASRETANRPMCLETDTSTPGGWSSRQFISASRLVETPTPSSRISMSTPPPGASAAATWTWVFRGENRVAFSRSSASRCTTSAAACPETMIPGWTVSATRPYCSISAAAARATSVSGTGSLHLRTGSSPARTSRFSELRRIRVTRWSMEKRWESWSGSSSFCSRLSIIRVSRSMSGTLRRDRLMNIALRLLRSCASVPASRTASAWTWSNARATRADLVGGLHPDRLDAVERGRVRLGELGPARGGRHPLGQPDGGDLQRFPLEPAQRVDHRPGDERRREQHQEHRERDRHRGDHRGLEGLVLEQLAAGHDRAGELIVDAPHPVDDRGHVGVPGGGRAGRLSEAEPLRPCRPCPSGKMTVGSPAVVTRFSISCAVPAVGLPER